MRTAWFKRFGLHASVSARLSKTPSPTSNRLSGEEGLGRDLRGWRRRLQDWPGQRLQDWPGQRLQDWPGQRLRDWLGWREERFRGAVQLGFALGAVPEPLPLPLLGAPKTAAVLYTWTTSRRG